MIHFTRVENAYTAGYTWVYSDCKLESTLNKQTGSSVTQSFMTAQSLDRQYQNPLTGLSDKCASSELWATEEQVCLLSVDSTR